jgi:hypothetical protein
MRIVGKVPAELVYNGRFSRLNCLVTLMRPIAANQLMPPSLRGAKATNNPVVGAPGP